jgi:hypothetical protein
MERRVRAIVTDMERRVRAVVNNMIWSGVSAPL